MKKTLIKLLLLLLLTTLITIFIMPVQIFAGVDDTYNHQLTAGFAGQTTLIRFWGTGYQGYYKFIMLYNDNTSEQIDCEFVSNINDDPWDIQMSNVLAAGNYHYNLVISGDWDMFNGEVYPIEPILNETHYFTITEEKIIQAQPWVRTKQMTCWQVWVNEDNNFEFIFRWEYANNNWVKIYDMSGNEVFAVDMKKGNPHFEADLPDGMYTVKTFHDDFETPIQEFIIGKP